MKLLRIFFWSFGGALCFFLLLAAGGCNRPVETQVAAPSDSLQPLMTLEHPVIDITQGAKLEAKVFARKIDMFPGDDRTHADSVYVEFFDDSGKVYSHLSSKSALLYEKKQLISGLGDCVVKHDNGVTLKSETLNWDPRTRMITTDDPVVITRGRNQVSGTGFQSDFDFRRIEIRSNVRGELSTITGF